MAVRPHRRVAALGILTGLAWTGTKLAVPALVARTIDRGVVPGDRGALLDNIAVLGAVGLAGALIAGLRRWYAQLLAFLIDARRSGKRVAAYGAAAKGNTLLNYCGVRTDMVDFVADKNPTKQGRYLPGSRIPVLGPEAIDSGATSGPP